MLHSFSPSVKSSKWKLLAFIPQVSDIGFCALTLYLILWNESVFVHSPVALRAAHFPDLSLETVQIHRGDNLPHAHEPLPHKQKNVPVQWSLDRRSWAGRTSASLLACLGEPLEWKYRFPVQISANSLQRCCRKPKGLVYENPPPRLSTKGKK